MGLERTPFMLATFHRPSNVDDKSRLAGILGALARVSRDMTVVFPVHPRTRARIEGWRLAPATGTSGRLRLIEPLGYARFIRLMLSAKCVLTDSGGIQAETSFLGVPCLTMRDTTERPFTVTQGTNRLVGTDPTRILQCVTGILRRCARSGRRIAGFDGNAGRRIVSVVANFLPRRGSRGTAGLQNRNHNTG
jgi:UDP-N-acetylglucosamine 2-epimerase (non-hydrolysing)